jgi:ectoine hydroxylase-related dioxygenase (phytanoyl-CoA dioxygenase family)
MKFKSYGTKASNDQMTSVDVHLEEMEIQGFTVVEDVVQPEYLKIVREKMDGVYKQQEDRFGKKELSEINELNMARCLLAEDDFFLEMATNPEILDFVKKMIGEYFILHLQNGVINRPGQEHHQSSWHRDLPYQDYIISKPIAISAFWCIDTFNENTGSTIVLPFSHKVDHLPSHSYINKHKFQVEAPPGSVILFNSMLYHCAGYNSSEHIRRGINHMYVIPILKQQISLPQALGSRYRKDPFLSKFLGYESEVQLNVDNYRINRLDNKK